MERLGLKLTKWVREMLSRHRRLLRGEPRETRDLFENVLSEARKGNFARFITDIHQKNPFGRSLAIHNAVVTSEILRVGIDLEKWVEYKEEEKEIYKEYDQEKLNFLWRELEIMMCYLSRCFSGMPIQSSVLKDLAGIYKMKKAIQAGQVEVPDGEVAPGKSPFFRTYARTIAYFKEKRLPILGHAINEFTYWPRLHEILRAFADRGEVKEYLVRIWHRDPLRDIFQGNFSGCCISVGLRDCYPRQDMRLYDVDYKKYPAGILEFLVDVGMQVAEIVDGDRSVGSCWLFLSKNDNGRADLVVDSIDIDANLVNSRAEKRVIRSCTLRFLKNYASAIGAERVLIGKVGPMMNDTERRPIVIDLETDKFPVIKLTRHINKVGGYFRDRPYFLESRHGNEAFQVK